jgi:hypothetical protein
MYFDLVGTNRHFNVERYKDRILLDSLEYDLYGNWIRSGSMFIYSIHMDKRELRKGPDYNAWMNTPVSFYEWTKRVDKPNKVIILGTTYDVVGNDIPELKLNGRLVGYLLEVDNKLHYVWYNYSPEEKILSFFETVDNYL